LLSPRDRSRCPDALRLLHGPDPRRRAERDAHVHNAADGHGALATRRTEYGECLVAGFEEDLGLDALLREDGKILGILVLRVGVQAAAQALCDGLERLWFRMEMFALTVRLQER
jgi:hypothetical protein